MAPALRDKADTECMQGDFVNTQQRRTVALAALGLALLLAGCTAPGSRVSFPPPATQAQMEKERAYLQQAFFTDPCMEQLRQRAAELKPGDTQLGAQALYAVEYAPNTQRRDGLAYRLHVQERDRVAYLYVSDGTAGSYRIYGPLPLWPCLRRQGP
jgi:hypothetical protein